MVTTPSLASSLPRHRQDHPEAGALAGGAFDFHASGMVLDNPVGNAQSQTGAVADRLGREERIEDLGQDLRRDAAAVVGDLDDDVGSGAAGLDRDLAILAAGGLD